MTVSHELSGERADLLASLRQQREFLRQTVEGIDEEQARQRSTVSELCLGGLIKHVTLIEQGWMRFAVDGPEAIAGDSTGWEDQFRVLPEESLAGLLAEHSRVAAHTDELVATLDLDLAHPLPPAPWFEVGATWTVRRVLLHIIAETAQHSGHADILRESIDGAKTMG